MNKLSTKIRQKQSITPKQILQSRLLELSLDEIEKELESEIQKNPALIEKNTEELNALLSQTPGIVEHGIFYNIAHGALISSNGKVREIWKN